MKKATSFRLGVLILLLGIALNLSPAGAANTAEDAPSEADSLANTPYVTMNVGVEISGMQQAAEQAAHGLVLIGESLDEIAKNHELSPEQRAHVEQSLKRVDHLGQNLNSTLEKIPGTLERSIAPMVTAGKDLSKEIKLILILLAVLLVLIILAALVAIYYFVLAPATRAIVETTGLLNDLAKTLETTAQIVESSSEQNIRILEKMSELSDDNRNENLPSEGAASR